MFVVMKYQNRAVTEKLDMYSLVYNDISAITTDFISTSVLPKLIKVLTVVAGA